MAQLDTLLGRIQKLAAERGIRRWTDLQLLDEFALRRRSEAAFAALVSRHGPMVLRVCRRVLNHEQDAEDAFQAALCTAASSWLPSWPRCLLRKARDIKAAMSRTFCRFPLE